VGVLATNFGASRKGFRYVQVAAFSSTMLFHLIPGVTETLTRLPLGAPLLPSAEAPALKAIDAALLAAFLGGLVLQLRWLRRPNAG
jgi:hypothetical protein